MNNKYQSTVAHQIAFFAESYCSVLHHTHSHNGWFGYKDTTLTHPFSIHHNPLSIFHCHPVLNIFLFLLCFFTFFHTHNHVFSDCCPQSWYVMSRVCWSSEQGFGKNGSSCWVAII
ncbi:copper chaperone homolog CCH isoform X2 [Glycine max]|uniref:copper chaperone homolog CCH isoform X2 n=1 Tax=Glycine max TaxID=3847 RepID=UPI001B3572A8|nr:copper chaperone homolog CCH isoform X2 [Glycine max]